MIVCIPLEVEMSMMGLTNSSMIMMVCIPVELNKLDMNPSFFKSHRWGSKGQWIYHENITNMRDNIVYRQLTIVSLLIECGYSNVFIDLFFQK
mgnify:CR=1 FL=1